ncbi:MAG: sensor histidine kinase [Aggregatilineales bacterium]
MKKVRYAPPHSLITQLVVWVIFPLSVILVAVAYGSVTLHEQAMRDLVGERDSGATSAAAQALTDRFTQRQLMLGVLVNQLAGGSPLARILTDESDLEHVFDGGLVAIDPQGNVLDAWQQGRSWVSNLQSARKPWVLDHDIPKPLVIANAQSADGRIILFGGISLDSLNIPKAIGILEKTPQTRFYIVAADGHIIEDSAGTDTGKSAKALPMIATLFNQPRDGGYVLHDDLITVSSPVDRLNWTLVVQESWENLTSSTLRLSAVAPLTMIPVLLLAMSVLAFGVTRILLPLQRLGQFAARLAWGDYNFVQLPVGGVREIHNLQAILVNLARRLQQAQAGMHSYIGAMLQGQEDERKRLSRELHDDTLQSLIALDQQRQMAQRALERDPAKTAMYLERLQGTLEQAIGNLRQLIRDMRPSYLEDLGLAPTLGLVKV